MPRSPAHYLEDLEDKGIGDLFMEKVAHRIDEYALGLFPT
jgi:hypothetical protein